MKKLSAKNLLAYDKNLTKKKIKNLSNCIAESKEENKELNEVAKKILEILNKL